MKYSIGFIGAGNMGSALAAAACKSVSADYVAVTNRTPEKGLALAGKLGCAYLESNAELAESCDFVVLAVKPQDIFSVTGEVAPLLRPGQTLVSMAAGVTTASLSALIPEEVPVVRILPNTPCAIGRGVVLTCAADSAAAEKVMALLASAGWLTRIDEAQMDAACTASGCSPAFAYIFIDAIARGAQAEGMDYGEALKMSANAVLGAAAMVLESGEPPETLCDRVCSKGGSTIEGVRILRGQGVPESVVEAVAASTRRNRELGRR